MKALLRAVRGKEPLVLFLDFDGTLAPLQTDPESVRIPPSRRVILDTLAGRIPTAIVTGRSIKDIQGRVALKKAAWAGNHGLEVRHGRTIWIHPEAKKIIPILKKAVREAEHRLSSLPGVRVEDKGLSASVHFREAPSSAASTVGRILREIIPAGSSKLRLTRGKKVFEIQPAVAWDKGRAVLCLIKRLDPKGRATPLYLGDDRTDEDAFRALSGRGVTALVGSTGPTSAQYRLADVAAVWRFLRALLLI